MLKSSCGGRSGRAGHARGAFDIEGSRERAFDVEGSREGAFDEKARIDGASRVVASATAPKSSKSSLGLSTPLRVGLLGVRVNLRERGGGPLGPLGSSGSQHRRTPELVL